MRRHPLPLLLLLAACQAPTDPAAPTAVTGATSNLTSTYVFHDLGIVGAGGYPDASGINRWGAVVGTENGYSTPFYAAILVPPRPLLGVAPGHYGFARAINDNGVIVGEIDDAPVLWNNYTAAPVPISLPGFTPGEVTVKGINNSGVVVGDGILTSTGKSRAFRWTAAGGVVLLSLGAGASSSAAAINDSGVVVGIVFPSFGNTIQATQWRASGGPMAIASNAFPSSVNLAGKVLAFDPVLGRYFAWTATGGRLNLFLPFSPANNISNLDRVAGRSVCGPMSCEQTMRISDAFSLQTLAVPAGYVVDGEGGPVNTCGSVARAVINPTGQYHLALWIPTACDR